MEPPIYAQHHVDARFVGHPLANQFALAPDRAAARAALGLPARVRVLAVLPGSRGAEIRRLGPVFLDAARRVSAAIPELYIAVPAANSRCLAALQNMIQTSLPAEPGPSRQTGASAQAQEGHGVASSRPRVAGPLIFDGHAREVLIAADIALVASGTATLEAMLAKCPMVVGYRIAPFTHWLIRTLKLMKTDLYALPNVLAGHAMIPELMQDDCTSEQLSDALLALYADHDRREAMRSEFSRLHTLLLGSLDGNAADHAAATIAELLETANAP